MAYRLTLPSSSLIHSVVHVSQLKKALAPTEQVQYALPALSPEAVSNLGPCQVLNRCLVRKGSKMVEQVQVHWSGQEPTAITWENLQELKQRFPHAEAWGQASFQEERNVMAPMASRPEAANVQGLRSTREHMPNSLYQGSEWTR